jgi:hypothetical protein
MVENITKHSQEGKLLEMSPIFHWLTSNNICQMLFGQCHEKSNNIFENIFEDFFNVITNITLTSIFNVSELILILKHSTCKVLKDIWNTYKIWWKVFFEEYWRNIDKETKWSLIPLQKTLLKFYWILMKARSWELWW